MIVLSVILGFFIGTSLGSIVVLFALSGSRNSAYWSFVERHTIIELLAKLGTGACVVACGVVFAYLGYLWSSHPLEPSPRAVPTAGADGTTSAVTAPSRTPLSW